MPTINYSRPSPNYWTDSTPIKAICLHGTSGEFAPSIGWLTNPASQASSNFIIDRDGSIYCLVNPYENKRAWGNGIPISPDLTIPFIKDAIDSGVNLNLVTVSIEHVASAADMIAHNYNAFTPAQKTSSLWLTNKLCQDFKIPKTNQFIVPHAAIDSVSRANCPGIINVNQYIKDLTTMNPNPNNLNVGQGFIDYLRDVAHEQAATEERYIKNAPGGVSVLRTVQGSLLMATQDIGANGAYLPSWTITKLA